MKNNRLIVIDYLRGLAMIIMILTHSLVPYFGLKNIFLFWDLIQFAVPIFVFCAGYLFFAKTLEIKDFNSWLYIKKRIVRVFFPFFIFFLVYLLILFITQSKNLNLIFIYKSLSLTGGIDINWLVLLFIQFAFLFPFLRYLIIKKSFLTPIYYLLSTISALYILFPNYQLLTTHYKLFMFLPWSLIIIYSYFFYKHKDNKKIIYSAIISGTIIFIISYLIKSFYSSSLGLFANKYPPNLYYLSYGFTIMNILYLFFSKITNHQSLITDHCILFISANSYSLFFIHYLVIYLLRYFGISKSIHWSLFFLTVTLISLLIQFLFNQLKKLSASMY